MIRSIELVGFKRFAQLDIEARQITLLTGINGAGKSSVFQALLLARLASMEWSDMVPLNGPYGLALGTAGEMLHPEAEGSEIAIGLRDEAETTHRVLLDASDPEAAMLGVSECPALPPEGLGGAGTQFSYLRAERLGPRTQLELSAVAPEALEIGASGEHVAEILEARSRDLVPDHLLHPETGLDGIRTLGHQVELWLADIIRTLRVETRRDLALLATSLRFREPRATAEWVRPANMGFGVSYALPIIVAGLAAPPRALLMVENPEAHLHPAGQSRLARFLARVAIGGVQVLVETHSDHIINGVRRAVVEDGLDPTQALVQYFGAHEGTASEAIFLDSAGRLSHWPTGFFDQLEQDLGAITRARRPS